jgi:TPR repeat protein
MLQTGLRYALCAYLFSIVSGLLHAAPVTYKEVTDGDLPHETEIPAYFVLDVGTNVFSGTSRWAYRSESPNIVTDRDDIAFTVPEGTYLESISYSINYKGVSGSIELLDYTLYPDISGFGTQIGRELITVPINRRNLFEEHLPLYSGNYMLSHGAYKHHLKANNYRDLEYTWEFTVATIPSEYAQARSVVEKAQEAYKNGDYEAALEKAQPLAELGNAAAQTLLGNMYENGRGVPQDYTLAVKWYMKAFRQDDSSAKYWLKLLHNKCGMFCLAEDFHRIVMPMANEGYVPAQMDVCSAYAMGNHGQDRDFGAAREWCTKAANQGSSHAQNMLKNTIPRMEKYKIDKQEETRKRIDKLIKEAEQGNLDAHLKLGKIYYYGDDLGGIEVDYNKAKHWLITPAEGGNSEAQIHLGMIYQEEGNIDLAIKWLTIPSQADNAAAQLLLGSLYGEQGETEKALALITKSAELNHAPAQFTLGNIYAEGANGIEQDKLKALVWYFISCETDKVFCEMLTMAMTAYGPTKEFEIFQNMPESEIEEAKKLANEWVQRHKNN